VETVARVGATRWTKVAEALAGRMGKQCRERCAAILPQPLAQRFKSIP
jgi:hypothetical protein